MILENNSKLMLKYQKAKAKLVEYDIPAEEYPRFSLNSNDLSYPTTYILSRVSECIIDNNQEELQELKQYLRATAQYYDSAFKSKDRVIYDYDFLLSGASAYFLNNDFGSAKVLASKVHTLSNHNSTPGNLLINVYDYLLNGIPLGYLPEFNTYEMTNNLFLDYFEKGASLEKLYDILQKYRKEIYLLDNPDDIFYVDILLAVISIACSNSSWKLLPIYSDNSLEHWKKYLTKEGSLKMLWPAQRLIAEKGLLRGENAIVQLPTGVGKTKSIEIIIRSAFLSNRANAVIIIAPLRALCNEITIDMYQVFGKEVSINQFSDVLQNDFSNIFIDKTKKQILICTPEKLSYILHHDYLFLNNIDMFIFDEGHMFDDGGRGAAYELLITHIRQYKKLEQQIILLSAVLPNSEEIKKWLFDTNGVLASDTNIISTPKSIGFSSAHRDIHFFSDNTEEEDYYIPRVLQVTKLKRLPRERKDKYFPDLSSKIDVAIYNAVKLCLNGGVAIYLEQQRNLKTVFNRILELQKHEYDLSNVRLKTDKSELLKMERFIEEYYGEDHYYTKAARLGFFPHSSNLQNGIKLAVEYGLKKKFINCVICTSTLAQGVNLPIKYLLVTSIKIAGKLIKTRDFQNLVGRTARSGIYTEGSIIITDSKIFDSRNNRANGGNYVWRDCLKLFDADASEACGSSILALVQDYNLDYEYVASGKFFAEYVINHIEEKDYLLNYAKKVEEEYLDEHPDKNSNVIYEEIYLRGKILTNIENYLCMVYSSISEDRYDESCVTNICANTLAYYLASDEERMLLMEIFVKLGEKIKKYPVIQLQKYSTAMSGIDLSIKIEQWINDEKLLYQTIPEQELMDKIINLYFELHDSFKYRDQLKEICQLWIEGKTPYEINRRIDIDITKIDTICNKNISYELNFLVGNICDLVEFDNTDETQIDPTNQLLLLQRKIKYGVPTLTAVSLCEKIFNDRLLAIQIERIMCNENVGPDKIIQYAKYFKKEISELLESYPQFFIDRFKLLV